jgi:GNAT superfamily N-acetyltransferase
LTVRPDGLAVAALPIRRLAATDLVACIELAEDRDWPPQPAKWRLLFAVGEIYGVDDPAGGLAAMVVLTRYGRELAAIGMMVVASRFGRQGLGRRLLSHVLEQAEGAVVHLTATSYGLPLYQRLGFRAVDTMGMQAGRFQPEWPGQLPHQLQAASPPDLESMAALDLKVFGADRRPVLAELLSVAEVFMVSHDAGAVTGFAAAWRDEDYLTIGPVVAADQDAAAALITSIAAGQDEAVRLDVRGGHSRLAGWAAARGLVPLGRTTLMVRGGDLPGDRDRLFAPVSVATG